MNVICVGACTCKCMSMIMCILGWMHMHDNSYIARTTFLRATIDVSTYIRSTQYSHKTQGPLDMCIYV